jgi:ATP-dependent Clp protease ATP-binding subunit ClpA
MRPALRRRANRELRRPWPCQTPRAVRALETARRAARELGHDYVGTEHILLGLGAETEGIAGRVLSRLDVSAGDVHAEILKLVGPGSPASELDRDALASIGIDLDEVRRRVEETFGPARSTRRARCPRA